MTPWWHVTRGVHHNCCPDSNPGMLFCCSKWVVCEKYATKYIIQDQKWTPTCVWLRYGLCARVFSPAWGAAGCFKGWGGRRANQSSNEPTLSITSHFLWEQSAGRFQSAYPQHCSSIVLVEAGASVNHPVLKSGSTRFVLRSVSTEILLVPHGHIFHSLGFT